jgi:hypothetical protein
MRGYYRPVRRRSCSRRGLKSLSVALLALAPLVATRAHAARVGLADVAPAGGGQAAVAALRARLEGRRDVTLPRDAARAALEAPLPADGAADGGDAGVRPRASQLVRAARDAYSRFDYDGALERLRQAELALASAAPGPELTGVLVDVNLLAGVVHADRGDAAKALDSFRLARRLDPERKALDPGSYRPKVVALYAQAGAPVEGRKSRLSVVTDPAGAEVWIDGQRAGVAPLAVTLEAGFHYVAAVAEGSAPRLERPVLRAGEDTRQSLLLARLPPEERVRQMRAAMAAGRVTWEHGATALCAGASLDLLVLVRAGQGADGAPEVAVYDARGGGLGAWSAAQPVEPVLVALTGKIVTAPPPGPGPLVASREGDRSPPAAAPWYRSWWVVPPLLALGAAAALGTLWIIDSERTTTYSLNRWCFDKTCSSP